MKYNDGLGTSTDLLYGSQKDQETKIYTLKNNRITGEISLPSTDVYYPTNRVMSLSETFNEVDYLQKPSTHTYAKATPLGSQPSTKSQLQELIKNARANLC
jgi:hypothetical protein